MHKIIALIAIALLLAGCSGKFWAGAGGGALGGAAAYELNFERQLDRIEEDLKDGKIEQEEYEIRKDQIRRDSFLKKITTSG